MCTFAQLLFDDTAALVTHLRRVLRVNRDDFDPGPDGLVVEQAAEYPDAHVVCGTGEAAVAQHEVEVEFFEHDHAVGLDESRRDLVPPIAALIGDVLLLLHLTDGLLPTASALVAAGDTALQDTEFGERLFEMPRAVDDRAIRECECVVDTHVDANGGAFVRLRLRLRVRKLDLQQDVPTRRLAQQDDVLDRTLS